jgi:hypothetical protein
MKAAYMPIDTNYKGNFERRFHLRLSFWANFFSFFTQEDPYEHAIKEIKSKSIEDALKSDREQLTIDFFNTCQKNKKQLSQYKICKELVDAC